MAADAYIHSAVSQLRDAVAALQRDIRTIQVDAYDHEERVKGEMSHNEYELATAKAELQERETIEHGQHKQEVQNRIRLLEAEMARKKQEVSKQSVDAANVVNAKMNVVNQLQALISQLESIAPSAR